MIWLVSKDFSHQIISCNVFSKDGTFELWATRPGDKSFKVANSEDEVYIRDLKGAIDYALAEGITTLNI